MTRTRSTIAMFVLGAAVVLAAMGYVTNVVLRLERQQTETKQQAVLEESVRLALWRIDAALSPIIAIENARPPHEYQPFYTAPHAADTNHQPIPDGQVLLPSPLLIDPPALTQLHFQIDPNGNITSPQHPGNNRMYLAFRYGADVTTINNAFDRLRQLNNIAAPTTLTAWIHRQSADTNHNTLHQQPSDTTVDTEAAPTEQLTQTPTQQNDQNIPQTEQASSYFQSYRNTQELSARTEQLKKTSRPRSKADEYLKIITRDDATPVVGKPTQTTPDIQTDLKPLWMNEHLLLVRTAQIDDRPHIQGVWLDWPAIKRTLKQTVADLFPAAQFHSTSIDTTVNPTRRLASLPVVLNPGQPATQPPATTNSPLHLPLTIAWLFALLAIGAIAVVLWGTLTLSERKTTFVSAVTHELRTPLTTFRLYADLLASEKPIEPEKKRRYVQTLQAEADRLTHLVENVLSFAKLERNPTTHPSTTLSPTDLIERAADRLQRRAQQAGLELQVHHAVFAPNVTVQTDPAAVEQILYNLVDNACKYASGDPTKPITILTEMRSDNKTLAIHVQDQGPGIPPHDARRLFRPFSRSARDAAGSAPGVGLGLALARGLAKQLGASLTLDTSSPTPDTPPKPGARFTLSLPLCDRYPQR